MCIQYFQFRKKIRDLSLPQVELEDKVLVRWLRARNNNLKDAEQMLRKVFHFIIYN
jgi:hypothetical protein